MRQSGTFLQNVPSTSSKHLPKFGGEQFHRIPGHSVIGLFASECNPPQTTQSCLIVKKTDVNQCEERKDIGKARIWSDKTTLIDHDSQSLPFGMTSSPLKQESEMDQNAPTHLALGCPRKEIGCKNVIPDMNLEPPAPIDNLEPTSSRTQSMELRSLLGHNEQPSSLKADFSPVVLLEQEPGGRWVKRLKISASGSFSVGTKSANLSGNTSHEKANKFLSKITKVTISGSELTAGKLHGEESMALDRPPALASNSVSSSINVIKKNLELLTSQSWMRRWLHNRDATAQKRPQPVVVCKPRGSKLEVDDFRKKQFPSIAAMALMGKALTGFQPCEFQNRGPYVVWRSTGVSEPT